MEVYSDYNTIDTAPPIILEVWDEDKEFLDNTDDFLGRAVIKLEDASAIFKFDESDSSLESPPYPKWHKLRMGSKETDLECGEILCSFFITSPDVEIPKFNLSEMVQTKEYKVDINVLGLRNL